MKIITERNPFNPTAEPDCEAQDAIRTALSLVAGKSGYRGGGEVVRHADVTISLGHNIYTTSITLSNPKTGGAVAYFCNGTFWLSRYPIEVKLI